MWPVVAFHDGSNELTAEEIEFAAMFELRGRPDMARCVRDGRKWQRYFFFNGGTVATTMRDFGAMFQALRRAWAVGGEQIEKLQGMEGRRDKAIYEQ